MTMFKTERFAVLRPQPGAAPTIVLPPTGHFIDGRFVQGSTGEMAPVTAAATEDIIASVTSGSIEDVDRAVAAAVAAQKSWGESTPRQRSELLHRIADIIEANSESLQLIESVNTGKPADVVADDLANAVDTFRFMAGAARAATSLAAGDYVHGHTSLIVREPVGVVGVVTPWNYPLLMAAWKIAPILAAGNSVVLKPSEETPLSTLKLAELLAGEIPDGILNIVTGRGRVVGQRLAEHPDVALVAITGSVVSGQAVAETASRTVKRVHLELGGKAPVVILADADLAAAAAGVRAAGFFNSGQDCGAACRVLVHSSVAERFTELLVSEVSAITIGAPGTDAEIGPMISRAHFDRVRQALADAAASGLTAVVGGHAIEGDGFFIEPTVFANVPAGAEITHTEIFGPVVSIETFDTTEEAIVRANETPYGLAASVWTKDSALSLSVPKQLDFGTVWVNSHLVFANELPWGGFKGSGYGRDLSAYAIDDFSRTKHVMLNHN